MKQFSGITKTGDQTVPLPESENSERQETSSASVSSWVHLTWETDP